MKLRFISLVILGWLPVSGRAQVDIEHRRVLSIQISQAVSASEETFAGAATFWFNENHFPWTNIATRVFFAGTYLDAELSQFLDADSHTAVGVGAGGGFYLDSVIPYANGERLAQQQFYGDSANARIFLNHTIPTSTPLDINLRATYLVSGAFYRATDSTRNFTLPADFLTQTMRAEFRWGGVVPGLTARRGACALREADHETQ